MAHYADEATFGARVTAARRARGYRSLKDLADAMTGSGITPAILQNIELGRRAGIDLSHVLNIAKTLGVPLSNLLAPISRPSDPLDLPDLGTAFNGMTASQFDAWLSATPASDYVAPTAAERGDRAQLQALRELQTLRRELHRLEVVTGLDPDAPEEIRTATRAKADSITQQIEQLRNYLQSADWDI